MKVAKKTWAAAGLAAFAIAAIVAVVGAAHPVAGFPTVASSRAARAKTQVDVAAPCPAMFPRPDGDLAGGLFNLVGLDPAKHYVARRYDGASLVTWTVDQPVADDDGLGRLMWSRQGPLLGLVIWQATPDGEREGQPVYDCIPNDVHDVEYAGPMIQEVREKMPHGADFPACGPQPPEIADTSLTLAGPQRVSATIVTSLKAGTVVAAAATAESGVQYALGPLADVVVVGPGGVVTVPVDIYAGQGGQTLLVQVWAHGDTEGDFLGLPPVPDFGCVLVG